jgi:hypothetical protein
LSFWDFGKFNIASQAMFRVVVRNTQHHWSYRCFSRHYRIGPVGGEEM